MFQQVSSLVLLVCVAVAPPIPAMQIRGTITGRPPAPKTLVLVANPYAPSGADSATAVAIGSAMRDRVEKSVASDYRVITRKEMNDALTTYGYGIDAVLTPLSAGQLARQLSARYFVTATMSKSASGFTVTARLIGTNLDVGQVVTASGARPADVGNEVGEGMAQAIKALADAKNCSDQAETKPQKAVEAANKALKAVPNFGLAEYCLAQLAMKADPVGAEAMTHLQNTVKGDPYSLVALDQISQIYQKKGDSTKTVETFQQMLRAAPTNKPLLETAFKLLLSYGKPDAAMEVADSGIKQDPTNTDWYDLKSNVCFAKEDYGCAVNALEQVFEVDSTRADTLFFQKILFATSTKPDTAKYLAYSLKAAQRYPDNAGLLEELGKAYTWTGQADSAVAVTRRLIQVDPSKTTAVLSVVQQLLNAGKYTEAIQFAPTIKQFGDEEAKNNFAGLVFQSMQKVVGVKPLDTALLVQLAEGVLSVTPTQPDVLLYTNYFYAIGLQPQLSELATSSRAQKSCDLAKKEQELLLKLEPAVTLAATSTNAAIADYAKKLLESVQTEKPAVVQMIGAFCK
ncbi:MAG: tetratricopeptide repeat protein [Gemmatimonadota bacterium]